MDKVLSGQVWQKLILCMSSFSHSLAVLIPASSSLNTGKNPEKSGHMILLGFFLTSHVNIPIESNLGKCVEDVSVVLAWIMLPSGATLDYIEEMENKDSKRQSLTL